MRTARPWLVNGVMSSCRGSRPWSRRRASRRGRGRAPGTVNALGQEFPAAAGADGAHRPAARRHIDLGDGIWVNVAPYTVAGPRGGTAAPGG